MPVSALTQRLRSRGVRTEENRNRLPVGQPFIAARTKKFLLTLAAGTFCGLASGFSMVAASSRMVRFDRSPKMWILLANLSAILLALICVMQLFLWAKAWLYWRGSGSFPSSSWNLPSQLGGFISWFLLIGVPIAGASVGRLDIYAGAPFWLALVSSFLAVPAALLTARWPINPLGPPRVCPETITRNVSETHSHQIRRLQAKLRRQIKRKPSGGKNKFFRFRKSTLPSTRTPSR